MCSSLHAEDFRVHGLGKIVEAFDEFDGRMYAGQMPTSRDPTKWEESKFMFWLFLSDAAAAPDTLTMWFNGGPGCSSMHGGLFENAPVSTAHYPAGYPETPGDVPLLVNEWAWTKATNMIYIEMPQGVGFSSGPMPSSEDDIGVDFYGFLLNFYDTFPEMKDKKLFLFGESYAGYYVPSIGHKIHQENLLVDDDEKVKLAGIGLGNGWVDAKTQGPAVIDFAWWHGMIDSSTKDSLHEVWKGCSEGKKMSPPFHDFTIPDECSIMSAVLAAAGAGAFPKKTFRSPNPYDVTTFDLYPVLFGKNTTIDRFYNNPEVKKALHAPMDVHWEGCIPGAGRRRMKEEKDQPGKLLLAHDQPESVAPYIAELLDAGVRVLIYNGDRDLTTCAQGSEMVLNGMKWSGQDQWLTADRGLWMVSDSVAGFSKTLDGLQFVVVYNAGHLLPNSNPKQALDLITRFVTDTPFLDIPLPRFDTKAPVKSPGNIFSKNPFHEPISHLFFGVILAAACFGLGYMAALQQRGQKEYYTELS
jgi:carboxypeptidase C (cathepsin A)